MMTRVTTRPTIALRERIIEAAADLTVEHGWAALTMDLLADRVGVSPEAIHDEVGTKPDLAESLVLWELGHYLEAVNAGFDDNPEDLVVAARDAIRHVLERAAGNSLLRAALASEDGDSGLLPLLTTDSASLSGATAVVLEMRLGNYDHGIDPLMLGALVDMIVRLVVSHVIRPAASPEETSEVMAWTIAQVLRLPA